MTAALTIAFNVLSWFLKSAAGRTILIAVVGAACLALAFKVHETRVERRVKAEIERKIKEQADAAARGATRVGDCYGVGGRWMQSEGRCVLPGVLRPNP